MSLPMFSLDGKRALVTGSSRGIGLAIAGGSASAAASVVLNGRDAETVTAVPLRDQGFRVDECPL